MTIIQKIRFFSKKKLDFFNLISVKNLLTQKFNALILISFLIIFSAIFFFASSFITAKNNENANNLEEITKTSEFANITNFLISKINSPYEEINYTIKNNDTVEKILKQFKIKNDDIRNVSIN